MPCPRAFQGFAAWLQDPILHRPSCLHQGESSGRSRRIVQNGHRQFLGGDSKPSTPRRRTLSATAGPWRRQSWPHERRPQRHPRPARTGAYMGMLRMRNGAGRDSATQKDSSLPIGTWPSALRAPDEPFRRQRDGDDQRKPNLWRRNGTHNPVPTTNSVPDDGSGRTKMAVDWPAAPPPPPVR
jgi:hypothetical protein